MSKRKNRNSVPNIPQETLDRARQQLAADAPPESAEPVEAVEPIEAVEAVDVVEAEVVAEVTAEPMKAAPPAASSRVAAQRAASTSRSRGTGSRRVQSVQSKGGRKDQLDTEVIKNRLQHPTRIVTEAQLREEYGYVVKDLRQMAIVAAAMIALMVILAQIL